MGKRGFEVGLPHTRGPPSEAFVFIFVVPDLVQLRLFASWLVMGDEVTWSVLSDCFGFLFFFYLWRFPCLLGMLWHECGMLWHECGVSVAYGEQMTGRSKHGVP